MPEPILVCEGDVNSVDERVLQHALVNKLGVPLELHPSGGSGNIGGVRQYLENNLRRHQRRRASSIFSIRDRDFRRSTAGETVLDAAPRARSFVWLRHEIENYLMEPAIVAAAFAKFSADNLAWARSLPSEPQAITDFLVRLGREICVDHVGKMVWAELHRSFQEADHLDAPSSGDAPVSPPKELAARDRDTWLDTLTRVADLLDRKAGRRTKWRASFDIEAEFKAIEVEVHAPGYWEERRHLIDFGGHELVSALWSRLHRSGATRLTLDALENELVRAFAAAYTPGQTFVPDEFQLLADRLRR